MKDITQREVEIRDEVAMRLLASIALQVKGPESLKSAIAVCYDVAERFIGVRRAVQNVDKADTEAAEHSSPSLVVKS